MKIFILNLLATAILLSSSLQALSIGDNELNETISKIPGIEYLIENNSMGTEFYIAIPPNGTENHPYDYIEIYITSIYNTEVTLETRDGIYLQKMIKAGSVVKFSTDDFELYFSREVRESEKVTDKGFHIRSVLPVSVYVINAKQISSDGYMAIPYSYLGTEYFHCSYYDCNEAVEWPGGFVIIGTEDDTKVRIKLDGRGHSKTAGGRNLGDVINITLDEMQTYMVSGDAKTRGEFDLTGTKITADKSIAVISFHMRTLIPSWDLYTGRDHLSEMVPPVHSLSNEYSALEFKRGTDQGDFFRIVAAGAGTLFQCNYYDTETNELIGEWSEELKNAGDFAEFLDTMATSPNNLKSIRGVSNFTANNPFLLMQYAYSEQWDGNKNFDPFMTLIPGRDQYIRGAIFLVPAGRDFQNNWVNIFAKGDSTDEENKLLKSIKIDGKEIYTEYPEFLENQIPGTNYYRIRVPAEEGMHSISGNTGLGAYMYGYADYGSYGWPAAMGFNKIDVKDTVPPGLKIEENDDGFKITATEKPLNIHGQTNTGISKLLLIPDISENVKLTYITDTKIYAYRNIEEFEAKLELDNKYKNGKAGILVVDRAGNWTIDSLEFEGTNSVTAVDDDVNISIHPNPATDYIIIDTDLLSGTIEIYNLLGIKVAKQAIASGREEIDVSSLPAGMYFLKAGDQVRKFVKR